MAKLVAFDCCQLVRPNRSSMVANCLHEQWRPERLALELHILVLANYAILEISRENFLY